ncbi:hypothetical protein N7520_003760 [Penicillium odoratum]|uniref:uncharacterized protein n=1 Tax=Penicillium odoratum TaxID=1167516 RepID=UPI00254894AE|nr:uncharacterized protein N7520_003760 [Penicillium odoratum]KAJ5769201.1 hypothetical protein N7520_003760 [Penicillium odoratum]
MTTTSEYQSPASSSLSTESDYVSTSASPPSTSSASIIESSTVATTTTAAAAAATPTTTTTTTTTTTNEGVALTASLTSYTGKSTSLMQSSSTSTTTVAKNSTLSIQSSQQNTPDSRISSGALAGAVVGAFAGGCILAFLVAFLCLRGRKKSLYPPAKEEPSVLVSSIPPKGPIQSTKNGPNASVTVANGNQPYSEVSAIGTIPLDLSAFVAEPADDSTVCTRVQAVFDQVSLHVDNYYSRPGSHRRLMPEMVAQINDFDSSLLGTSLATLLSNSRSQRAILTHTLLHAILAAIQSQSQGTSLTPACYRLGTENDLSNVADDRAVFAWRMLTSYLYIKDARNNSAQVKAQEDLITRFANTFTETFAPYSDPQFNEADRLAHMISVTRTAVNLGVWLFSQPCSITFRWSTTTPMVNQVVILPAVVKTCDEHGVRMAVPQTLLEEFTRQI